MGISVHLLGAPRIERDGLTVHIDTRKAIALIAYLAIQGGYQSRDTLSVLLWAENDHVGARAALRRTLSALNSALEGTGLLIEREAVAFDAGGVWCDLVIFNEALHQCETHGHAAQEVCPRCLIPLRNAVDTYKGDFLQGFTLRDSAEYDLWQFQQTEHLRGLYAGALEKLVWLYSQSEQYAHAIELARRWLALDPLHEAAHARLIQLYAWSGQRSLALRQYHECVRVLEHELGVPPLEETARLYKQVMDNVPTQQTANKLQSPQKMQPAEMVSQAAVPFIGREQASFEMDNAYAVPASRRGVIVVEGEAGIGKTRLIENFAMRHQDDGATVVRFHCFESETHIAYAPVIRALREHLHEERGLSTLAPHWVNELARLLPEVQPPRSELGSYMIDTTAAQTRLYEAVCQALSSMLTGTKPGILLFEDAQWADSATLDLAAYWLRRANSGDEQIVMTWRSEEVARGHRLRLLLADYARGDAHVTWLTLPRLTRGDIGQIMRANAIEFDEKILQRIFDDSEGLPLFIHEYLKLLQANPQLQTESEWRIPAGVQQLLHSRVAQASEVARQILETAAVIGRAFDLELVQECSGRTEGETVDGADELQRRGIWREGRSPVTYEFHHEKVRAVVYQEMSMARKRLLHRRVAQTALNRVGKTDKRAASAAFIAFHFQIGGLEAQAAEYYVLAGCYARDVFANQDALNYFEHGLALGYAQPTELYRHLGDVNTILGQYRAAIYNYEAGIAHALPAQIIELEQALGRVYHRLGDWELAERYFQSAFHAVDSDASTMRATLLIDWSLTRYSAGDIPQAQQLVENALVIAEQSESAFARAQAYNMLGILARKCANFQQASTYLQRSVQMAESLGDTYVHVAALNNLALTHVDAQDYERAQSLWEQALEQCVRQGDRHHEAALHNNLSDLFHAMGLHERAMEHLKRAVILFAQIGIDGHEMKPEIWKLAEW